jgi:TP901 family phage tail tape measure protein
MPVEVGTAIISVRGDLKALRTDMMRAQKETRDATKAMQKSIDGMAKHAETAGRRMRAAMDFLGIAAGVTAVRAAVKTGNQAWREYESSVAKMGQVGASAVGNFSAVRGTIESLSPALGTLKNLTDGYYNVISAGVQGQQRQIDMLVDTAKATRAANDASLTHSKTIEVTAKVMNTLGSELKTPNDALDLMFTIVKKGITTFGELVPVMGTTAAMAKDASISANELGGAFAEVTKVAGSTAEAATNLRSLFSEFIKPSQKLAEVYEELGFSSGTAMVKQLGLVGSLKELQKYAESTGQEFVSLFGRQEAMIAVSALAKDGFEDTSAAIDEMANRTGMAEKAFQDYGNTSQAVADTFDSTVNRVWIMFGEEIAPTVNKAMKEFSDWVMANQEGIKASFEGIGWAINFVSEQAKNLGKISALFGLVSAGAVDMNEATAAIAGGMENVNNILDSFNDKTIQTRNAIKQQFAEYDKASLKAAEFEEKLTHVIDEKNQAMAMGATDVSAYNKQITILRRQMNTFDNAAAKAKKAVENLTASLKDSENFEQPVASTAKAFGAVKDAVEVIPPEMKKIADASKPAKKAINENLNKPLKSTEEQIRKVRDEYRAMIDDIDDLEKELSKGFDIEMPDVDIDAMLREAEIDTGLEKASEEFSKSVNDMENIEREAVMMRAEAMGKANEEALKKEEEVRTKYINAMSGVFDVFINDFAGVSSELGSNLSSVFRGAAGAFGGKGGFSFDNFGKFLSENAGALAQTAFTLSKMARDSDAQSTKTQQKLDTVSEGVATLGPVGAMAAAAYQLGRAGTEHSRGGVLVGEQFVDVGDVSTGDVTADPAMAYVSQQLMGQDYRTGGQRLAAGIRGGDTLMAVKSLPKALAEWAAPLHELSRLGIEKTLSEFGEGATLIASAVSYLGGPYGRLVGAIGALDSLVKEKTPEFTMHEQAKGVNEQIEGFSRDVGLEAIDVGGGGKWYDKIVTGYKTGLNSIFEGFNENVAVMLEDIPEEYQEVFLTSLEAADYSVVIDSARYAGDQGKERVEKLLKTYAGQLTDILQEAHGQYVDAYVADINAKIATGGVLGDLLGPDVSEAIAGMQYFKTEEGETITRAAGRMRPEEAKELTDPAEIRALEIEAAMDRQKAIESLEGAWKSLNDTLDSSLEELTPYERKMRDLDRSFEIQLETITKLGFSEKALGEVRAKQAEIIAQEQAAYTAQRQAILEESAMMFAEPLGMAEQAADSVNQKYAQMKVQLLDIGATQQDLTTLEQNRLQTVQFELQRMGDSIVSKFDAVRKQIEEMEFTAGGGTAAGFTMQKLQASLAGPQTMESLQQASSLLTQWYGQASAEAQQAAQTATQTYSSAQSAMSTATTAADTWSKVTDNAQKLADSFDSTLRSLEASSLNIEDVQSKYNTTQKNYEDLLRKAQTGDESAIREIQQYSRTFLTQSQARYASSIGYQKDYARVTEDLESLQAGLRTGTISVATAGAGVAAGTGVGIAPVSAVTTPGAAPLGPSMEDVNETFRSLSAQIERQLDMVTDQRLILEVDWTNDAATGLAMLDDIIKTHGFESTFTFAADLNSLGAAWEDIDDVLRNNGVDDQDRLLFKMAFELDWNEVQKQFNNFFAQAEGYQYTSDIGTYTRGPGGGATFTEAATGASYEFTQAGGAQGLARQSAIYSQQLQDVYGTGGSGLAALAKKWSPDWADQGYMSGIGKQFYETSTQQMVEGILAAQFPGRTYTEWDNDMRTALKLHGVPGYRYGGIASPTASMIPGPTGGYMAELHGREEIKPLGPGGLTEGDRKIIELLAAIRDKQQNGTGQIEISIDGQVVRTIANEEIQTAYARDTDDGRRPI